MSAPTPIGRILGECQHGSAVLSRHSGNNAIGFYCSDCARWVIKEKGYDRLWLPKDHPALKGLDLVNLPTPNEKYYRKCEGPCARITLCQLHHMAPQTFFADADEWPVAYLCPSCHARWHTRVTPGLCTAYDATAHAAQLIQYLGLERSAALTKQLIALGRARRAGAA